MQGEKKMKAFIGDFPGFESKEGFESNYSNHFFPVRFFDPRVCIDRGLKDEYRNKFLAQNSV